MLKFIKRLLGLSSGPEQPLDLDDFAKEQWQADFSRQDESGKTPRVRFSITSENQYCAYLDNKALCLGLKKSNCIAWTENRYYRYRDIVIKSQIKLDPRGGYAAAGMLFHMVDDRTYYMVLVSNRGYYRLDVVRNSVPLTLAGWTEAPHVGAHKAPFDFDLEIICYGSHICLLINGLWAGNWNEPSIPEGRIGFTAASYEADKTAKPYTAIASLLSFSLNSHIEEVEKRYEAMENAAAPDARIRLAETFAAMGHPNPALVQLRKAWERREELEKKLDTAEDAVLIMALRNDDPDITSENKYRAEKELILAAKLAMALEQWDEADDYIEDALKRQGEFLGQARNIKAALFYARGQYQGLIEWAASLNTSKEKSFAQMADELFADPSALFNLLGNSYFNMNDYQKAAEVYDYAFTLDDKNGIAAKNAAVSYELLGKNEESLDRYLKAGRVFLADDFYHELGLLIPKFNLLGKDNWEAAAITGKWAFGIEDWPTAKKQLDMAEKLRKETNAQPDSAIYYLQALLLVQEGKRQKALSLFEKAVKYAPDYPLFRFRLAENRYLLNGNINDSELQSDLQAALKTQIEDGATYGWIHNFAAQIELNKGNLQDGVNHLEKAASVLGEVPEVRVNRAVSLYLQNAEEEALELLECNVQDDPKGIMANCAGNLLVRSKRFEEADKYYLKALSIDPNNNLYRYNRASCLIELGSYGEADTLITSATGDLTPDMLELIAFIAVKKGEYSRAETAARAALKLFPGHVPSMLQLGWAAAFARRWDEVEDILDELDKYELNEDTEKGKNDLEAWLIESLYRTINCAACQRTWQVKRDTPRVTALRVYGMPPDDMPGGTCPSCGKTYCVGCRKDGLDSSGRFTCPDCATPLKLTDDGLKEILNEWAKKNIGKDIGK